MNRMRCPRNLLRPALAAFIAAAVLLALPPGGPASAAPDEVRVGINPDDFPPYEVLDVFGRARGADFDLLRLIAEREGLRLRFVETPSFGGALDMLAAGDIDLLGALAKTPEREARFLYSSPYDESPVAIFGRAGVAPALRLEELSGRRVALPTGYAQAKAVQARVPDVVGVEVANNGEAIRALQRGDADYAVGNFVTTRHLIVAEGLDAVRLMAPTDIGTGRLHFAISPKRPELREAIDRGVAAFSDRWPDILAANLGRRHWIDAREVALAGTALLAVTAAIVLWRL